ncbi:MAG: ribosome maturation factor RimM [Treponema sp.]|jgi:16S rRNA processing protein RimM|nr:ribosome maturation factor RimM [Treponema sp.]
MTGKFIIGIVGAPFGVNGMVKVRPFSGDIDNLLKLKSVIISQNGNERELKIDKSAPAPPFVLMGFSGVNNPEAVKKLTGAKLILDRERASPLDHGEYYVEDLKGLTVITENGDNIGEITDIIEGGNGELAEIRLTGGEIKLVPFRQEFFTGIEPENNRIILANLWILE